MNSKALITISTMNITTCYLTIIKNKVEIMQNLHFNSKVLMLLTASPKRKKINRMILFQK